jgi:hypothetical protein
LKSDAGSEDAESKILADSSTNLQAGNQIEDMSKQGKQFHLSTSIYYRKFKKKREKERRGKIRRKESQIFRNLHTFSKTKYNKQ